jgi:hypothetical protein
MAETALTTRQERESCRYLDGYFAQQFAAGARPDYGYPKNHLPETTLDSMEVVTGFMASAK